MNYTTDQKKEMVQKRLSTLHQIDSLEDMFYEENLSVNEVLSELAEFKDKRFFLALDKVYEFIKELKGALYASKFKSAIMDVYFEGEQ